MLEFFNLKICKSFLLLFFLSAFSQANDDIIVVDLDGTELKLVKLPNQDSLNLSDKTDSSNALVATYLMETELSCAQLKALLGESRYREYLDKSLSVIGKNAVTPDEISHREKLQNGSPELAALVLTLDEIIPACKSLKEKLLSQTKSISEIETVVVRLPAQLEWRFAAWANEDFHEQGSFPLFPIWPSAEKLRTLESIRNKMSDLQEHHEGFTYETLADPIKFVTLADKEYEFAKSTVEKAYSVVGDVLATLGPYGIPNNYTELATCKRDRSVTEAPSNQFGLKHMFGNISEWAIESTSDLQAINEEWNNTLNGINSTIRLVSIGGQTFYPKSGQGSWRQFSLNTGLPYQNGQQKSYSVEEANQIENNDFFSGCRLLVKREIKNDWFVTYRSKYLAQQKKSDDSFNEFLVRTKTTINEVSVEGAEKDRNLFLTSTYEKLLLPEEKRTNTVNSIFEAATAHDAERDSNNKVGKPKKSDDVAAEIGNLFGGDLFSDEKKPADKEKESKVENDKDQSKEQKGFFAIYAEMTGGEVRERSLPKKKKSDKVADEIGDLFGGDLFSDENKQQ